MASSFWNTLSDAVGSFAAKHQAREEARHWLLFRPQKAHNAINEFVTAAVGQQNADAIAGALDELAEQIKLVESWELQQEYSALLWYFKERVGAELAAVQAQSNQSGTQAEEK